MARNRHRLLSLGLTGVLALLNLVALNYLISGWSGARLDLTSDGMFSITPATKRLLGSLDEELTIYGYFSNRTHPKLAPLVPQIVDLLDEYRAVSKGKVVVEILDPGEDEAAEEEAAGRFGVRSTPFRLASKYESGIVNAYFALVVRYGDQYERYGFQDLIQVDPLPDGDIDVRLRNLEYDLTRAIKKVLFGFQGTTDLFARLDQPVKFTAIMSPESLPEMLAEVPDAVREAAAELAEKSGDKFTFEEVDPTGDELLAQDLSLNYGFRPMSLGFFGEESFYLYGLLDVGGVLEQVILTGEELTTATVRETIEQSLRRYTPGFLKRVGVVAPTQPEIPPEVRAQLQMPPPQPPEFQEIKRFLSADYDVAEIDLGADEGVPHDIDVLLVLKPRELPEMQLFRLDQYLMRGGRVVLCAGNYEVNFDATGLNLTPMTSGLDDWLAHHGVTVSPSLVLDDRNQPLPIPETRQTALGPIRTWSMAPYPYLLQVRDEGFANPDITSSLDAVGIYWGSPLTIDEKRLGEIEALPILKSSEVSWTSDDVSQVAFVDYDVPAEGTEPHLLAVALNGRFKSYFAEKGEPRPEADLDIDGNEVEDEDGPAPSVAITESPDTRLVVVGNSEFLSDFVARALGNMEGGFFTENLRFVENLIDWTNMDGDMIGIRSRGLASRRIDAVERGEQFAIEFVNYAVPLIVVVALAVFLFVRRRNAQPLFDAGAAPIARNPTEKEA
ncbi:MAG: hypothetical protein GY716_18265 [bacterium]|nr:hypothetical protein [bacterium]